MDVYVGECGSLRMIRDKLHCNSAIEVNWHAKEILCEYIVSTHI